MSQRWQSVLTRTVGIVEDIHLAESADELSMAGATAATVLAIDGSRA